MTNDIRAGHKTRISYAAAKRCAPLHTFDERLSRSGGAKLVG